MEEKDSEDQNTSAEGAASGNLLHVAIKTPQFSQTHCQGWFNILEAQFEIARVTTESTKYFNTLSALPPECVGRIPPECLAQRNYASLKSTVLSMYEQTKGEIFQRLMKQTTLGQSRPSEFLREMQQHALKVGVGDDLVRHQFVQAMPPAVMPVLATQKELSLTQLASLADDVVAMSRSGSLNAVVQQPAAAEANRSHSPERGRSRKPARSRDRAHSPGLPFGLRPFHSSQKPMVCRAHLYFADKAKTCKPWCKFPKGGKELNMQPSSRASSPQPGNSRGT